MGTREPGMGKVQRREEGRGKCNKRELGTLASLNEVDSGLRFIARQYPNMREAKVAIQRVVCVAKPRSGLKKSLEEKPEDDQ